MTESDGAPRIRGYFNGGLVDQAIAGRIRPQRGVIVTGFWRSGTTFLLERLTQLLRAKPLFEPFQPELPEFQAIIDQLIPSDQNRAQIAPFVMPYAMNDSLAAYLEQVLRYRIVDARVQRSRTNLTAHGRKPRAIPQVLMQQWLALRCTVVVKFVRASLLIPAIQHRFQVPIFHIRRQPHGVLASFKTADWSVFRPEHLSLRRLLLDIDDGRAVFFDSFRGLIDEYDQRDPGQRLIAYRALTERFVDAHASACTIVPYEALATGEYDLKEALRGHHREPLALDDPAASFNSSTTSAHRAHMSAVERVESWRHILTRDEIRQVDAIVDRVQAIQTA